MKSRILHAPLFPISPSGDLGDAPRTGTGFQTFFPGFRELPKILEGDAIILPDFSPGAPPTRLVVLVPNEETDDNALARRVWEIASGSNLDILYLSLLQDDLQVARQRCRLASLTSLTSFREVHSQASMSTEAGWLNAVKKIYRPGDLLVCLESQKIPEHIVMRRPLGEFIAESLSFPVYLIAGVAIKRSEQAQRRLNEILAWPASIVLMIAFFILQVGIYQSAAGSISTILLYMSALIEIYLLYKLNEWIG